MKDLKYTAPTPDEMNAILWQARRMRAEVFANGTRAAIRWIAARAANLRASQPRPTHS